MIRQIEDNPPSVVGRVIPNAPPNRSMVGRVILNAPPNRRMVGHVILNAPPNRRMVGRVILNAPESACVVGRVILNAPQSPNPDGGLRTTRPTNAQNPDGALRTTRPTNAPLLDNNNAIQLLFALEHYRTKGDLFPRLAVVMPDHIHIIASFPETVIIAQLIRSWKRWTAKETGITWQSGFFEHRLRNDAEVAEKMAYVANNPVRKGLCESADAWPFRMSWQ